MLPDLLEAAAVRIMAAKPNSDTYLVEEVMPSISDDQFAAVVGIHGFLLVSALAVDPKSQVLEGVLQRQDQEASYGLTIRGSYVRNSDGEFVIEIQDMATHDTWDEHQSLSYDPESDAVLVMKALARLLGSLP